jgi:hypothetical protein
MPNERIVLCGGSTGSDPGAKSSLVLHAYGPHANVHFRLQEIRKAIWTDVPTMLRDLIDIALYVYVADQATPRGTGAQVDGAFGGRVAPEVDLPYPRSTPGTVEQ